MDFAAIKGGGLEAIVSGSPGHARAFAKVAGHAAGRVAKTLFPVFAWYNPAEQAKGLAKEAEMQEIGVTEPEAEQCLRQVHSEQAYRLLHLGARGVDTIDRAMSEFGFFAESIGALLGVLPLPLYVLGREVPGLSLPFGLNIVEESAEIVPKLLFSRYVVAKFPQYSAEVGNVLFKEFVTSAIPIVGDLYDIARNPYVEMAENIIRAEARTRIKAASSSLHQDMQRNAMVAEVYHAW